MFFLAAREQLLGIQWRLWEVTTPVKETVAAHIPPIKPQIVGFTFWFVGIKLTRCKMEN